LIVPFSAGGANDSIARLLANKLGPTLGQTAIVENRPGGGTVIGSAAVGRSKADGYTILLVSAAHTINPHILKNIPYDTLQDFTPISQLTRTAYILVTSQASKFDKIEDLVNVGAAPNGQSHSALPEPAAPPISRDSSLRRWPAGMPRTYPTRAEPQPSSAYFAATSTCIFRASPGRDLSLSQNRCVHWGCPVISGWRCCPIYRPLPSRVSKVLRLTVGTALSGPRTCRPMLRPR
jgi:hypothetical protein